MLKFLLRLAHVLFWVLDEEKTGKEYDNFTPSLLYTTPTFASCRKLFAISPANSTRDCTRGTFDCFLVPEVQEIRGEQRKWRFRMPWSPDVIQDRTRKLHRAVCNEVIWKVRKCSVQTGTQIHEPAEVKNPFYHRQTNCCCCLPDESHQEGSQEASQNSGEAS